MTELVETIEAGVEGNGVGLREYQVRLLRKALELYIGGIEENTQYHKVHLNIQEPLALTMELREAKHLLDIFPQPVTHAKDETGQTYGILWAIMKTYYKEQVSA